MANRFANILPGSLTARQDSQIPDTFQKSESTNRFANIMPAVKGGKSSTPSIKSAPAPIAPIKKFNAVRQTLDLIKHVRENPALPTESLTGRVVDLIRQIQKSPSPKYPNTQLKQGVDESLDANFKNIPIVGAGYEAAKQSLTGSLNAVAGGVTKAFYGKTAPERAGGLLTAALSGYFAPISAGFSGATTAIEDIPGLQLAKFFHKEMDMSKEQIFEQAQISANDLPESIRGWWKEVLLPGASTALDILTYKKAGEVFGKADVGRVKEFVKTNIGKYFIKKAQEAVKDAYQKEINTTQIKPEFKMETPKTPELNFESFAEKLVNENPEMQALRNQTGNFKIEKPLPEIAPGHVALPNGKVIKSSDISKYDNQGRRIVPEEYTIQPSGEVTKNPAILSEKFRESVKPFVETHGLSDYTKEDYTQMKVALTSDGKTGYAIKPNGELISVHNKGEKGAGKGAVIDAIENGATKLDAYDGKLVKYYKQFGFEEVRREKWNDQYAPKEWDYEKYGKPDVVYMELNPKKYAEYISRESEAGHRRVDFERSFRPVSGGDRSVGQGAELGKSGLAPGRTNVPPIEGTGEAKARGLSTSVEEKAIEKKISDTLGDLPQYKTLNLKDQAQKAVELMDKDYEQAKRIAMGQESPPTDILPESVYVAVEARAVKEGDINTLRDLATMSGLTGEATTMGQRIRTLGEIDPESPLSGIMDVQKVREKKLTDKIGDKKVKQEKQKIKDEIKQSIKKSAPTKETWQSFISSLQC